MPEEVHRQLPYLSLVTNHDDAKSMKDYHPIAYAVTLCKVVSKILSQSIGKAECPCVLSSITSMTQSTNTSLLM